MLYLPRHKKADDALNIDRPGESQSTLRPTKAYHTLFSVATTFCGIRPYRLTLALTELKGSVGLVCKPKGQAARPAILRPWSRPGAISRHGNERQPRRRLMSASMACGAEVKPTALRVNPALPCTDQSSAPMPRWKWLNVQSQASLLYDGRSMPRRSPGGLRCAPAACRRPKCV
jgi:hypothetical protein